MVSPVLEQELHRQLEALSPERQRQVFDYARGLSGLPRTGVLGATLLRFAGTIDAADLKIMSQAADEDCGRVRPRQGWAEQFQRMARLGDDRLLDSENLTTTDWDEKE